MREKEIEKYLKYEVEKIGGLCYKFTSCENGVPDRIVIYKGQTIFVEMKNKNGVLSAIQRYQIGKMSRNDATVMVLNSKDEVDEFINDLIIGLRRKQWFQEMSRTKRGDAF